MLQHEGDARPVGRRPIVCGHLGRHRRGVERRQPSSGWRDRAPPPLRLLLAKAFQFAGPNFEQRSLIRGRVVGCRLFEEAARGATADSPRKAAFQGKSGYRARVEIATGVAQADLSEALWAAAMTTSLRTGRIGRVQLIRESFVQCLGRVLGNLQGEDCALVKKQLQSDLLRTPGSHHSCG